MINPIMTDNIKGHSREQWRGGGETRARNRDRKKKRKAELKKKEKKRKDIKIPKKT